MEKPKQSMTEIQIDLFFYIYCTELAKSLSYMFLEFIYLTCIAGDMHHSLKQTTAVERSTYVSPDLKDNTKPITQNQNMAFLPSNTTYITEHGPCKASTACFLHILLRLVNITPLSV